MNVNAYERKMARLAGLEPATLEFEARYSIQLSYKRTSVNLKWFNSMAQLNEFFAIGDITAYRSI